MFEPLLLEGAGDHVGDRGAVFGVVMDQRDGVGLGARRLHVREEVEIDLGEVGGDRRGAEEPFEAALGEIGRNRLAVEEGNAVFLGDRARRQRDAGLVGAGERDHLLFGDQAQRLVLPGRGAALVVGENHLDLGAAEAGEAGVLRQREIAELGMGVVDDIHRDFDRGLGMDAGAGGIAAQRKHRADLDGLVLREAAPASANEIAAAQSSPRICLNFMLMVSEKCHPDAGLCKACRAFRTSPSPALVVAQALHAAPGRASCDTPPRMHGRWPLVD